MKEMVETKCKNVKSGYLSRLRCDECLMTLVYCDNCKKKFKDGQWIHCMNTEHICNKCAVAYRWLM